MKGETLALLQLLVVDSLGVPRIWDSELRDSNCRRLFDILVELARRALFTRYWVICRSYANGQIFRLMLRKCSCKTLDFGERGPCPLHALRPLLAVASAVR